MNQLQVIYQQKVLNKNFEVYGTYENPLFLAKDVTAWIEHSQPSKMLITVDEDEKLRGTIFLSGQKREMWFLTEDGLYEVLMQSRKPIAKQFKKQVKAILKEIRTQGAYVHAADDEDEVTILAKGMLAAQRAMERKDRLIAEQKLVIEQQKPKVLFAEAVQASSTSILIGEFAKILKQNGVDIGQKRLFQWLRKNGYLIKQEGTEKNLPIQRYIERGWFKVRATIIKRTEGDVQGGTTLITGKGQVELTNLLLKEFKNEIA
ncbi:phage antirepressor [Metasolibacillus meyeri]|uniref:phage antirepressor n=1 Tax=Metasolibacillus meyeri TaxID=1071052 RepID=UPI000D309C76|nr:phage antirepressor KilAC domain-containing protein [Metasolibacillus meyeri]